MKVNFKLVYRNKRNNLKTKKFDSLEKALMFVKYNAIKDYRLDDEWVFIIWW